MHLNSTKYRRPTSIADAHRSSILSTSSPFTTRMDSNQNVTILTLCLRLDAMSADAAILMTEIARQSSTSGFGCDCSGARNHRLHQHNHLLLEHRQHQSTTLTYLSIQMPSQKVQLHQHTTPNIILFVRKQHTLLLTPFIKQTAFDLSSYDILILLVPSIDYDSLHGSKGWTGHSRHSTLRVS